MVLTGLFDTDLDEEPQIAAPQVSYRGFADVDMQRQQIYDNALRGVGAISPVENDRYRIEIANARYANPKYRPSLAEEKQAMLARKSLHRPLKGTVRLINKETGEVDDEVETTLAHIPHLTRRGIFLRNGTVWGGKNQNRLRPGVYALRQQNGNIKAQVNAKPGTGRVFNVELDPKSGIFKLAVGQSGTRLYPALRAMGIPDDTIREAWGEELFKKNWRAPSGKDALETKKLIFKLGRRADLDVPEKDYGAKLAEVLGRVGVDSEVVTQTLGQATDTFSPELLMRTTSKMLQRSRDEVDDDNRDSQAYQSFHSAEDFFEERLARPHEQLRKLLWKASREGKLGSVQSGILDKNLNTVYQSGLMQAIEDTNPFEVMDSRQSITRLGEGGISSNQAVPRSARGVQPSYFGIIDPIRAPEGQNIGVDMRVSDGALKGSDGKLYFRVRGRDGEMKTVSALEATNKPIAFPGEIARAQDRELYRYKLLNPDGETTEDLVLADSDLEADPELMEEINARAVDRELLPPMARVIEGDDIGWRPLDQIDYELPAASDMFSRLTNMVPLTQGSKSQRALMGARMFSQALPLRDAEAPLVQSAGPDGNSLYGAMGEWVGAVKAQGPGRVVRVTPDHIDVMYEGGKKERHELYNHYPLARKTMLHNEPVVSEGDVIKPGQTLARSNFTDADGVAAPGRNMRVAYMVGEGGTYEDGFVISESAAKALTSQHSYKHALELDDTVHSTSKADYRAIFGSRYEGEQMDKLDDDGVIREGQTVNPGDPVLLTIGKRPAKAGRAVATSPRARFADQTQTWDHHAPGVVTDVVRTKKGVKVNIKSYEHMTEGSKLSARFGNKGVIAEIRPDGEMPQGADGEPIDVLVNALGVVSRANPSVLVETLLGKVAKKTGKPYVLKSFDHDDLVDFALAEAKKHGVDELETLTDPKTGSRISEVFTGQQYMMRLHHTAEAKVAARDTGGYTYDETPAKGGPEGSKRIAVLDTHSLLSYGATNVLKDAKLVRGQRNDEYWRSLKLGQTPQVPQKSFANQHFLTLLKGAGVNVRDRGAGRTQLAPMTDADIDRLAMHEVENADTFDFETMRPKEGGLFDQARTGGVDGSLFAKITLPQKIPNPVMEEPIIRMLGLTRQKFLDTLKGEHEIDGKTGPEAIASALEGLKVDREIKRHTQGVKTGSKSKRDEHVRALNYLTGLKDMDLEPKDLLISKVPVIPPKYRPVLRVGDMDIVNDANYLYHDLIQSRSNYTDAQEAFGEAGEEYLTMYNAAKAVTGLGNPVNPEHQEQNVKGLLRSAIGVGQSPKFARFQRKVIGQSVDNVGRGVITPDPELDMDQIAIPEEMAWTLYRPFAIRRLVRSGWSAKDAVKAVRDKKPAARRELMAEMEKRPVYWNRAPSLHRYNYVGAYPTIAKGNNIGLPQVTEPGANADHDGDMVNVHIPVSSDAVKDVIEKMMPSKNLWHPSNFDVHLKPDKDYLAGLYIATNMKADKEPRTFASREDAYQAYLRGEIGVADPVVIAEDEA